ncbi:hypothetical protein BDF20DRAFT_917826 [Mycotypha africana]|nr:uncharacterized protein BDF20DRAFT_917826 [Mycotypha africana]KAI8967160.1 hypothetical protein BDF20DRAFT_917826 [Mycotypha africana]
MAVEEKPSNENFTTTTTRPFVRSTSTTGADIGELQQNISLAENELNKLKLELDQTRKQAKQAEANAQESGRTNRSLKTELQTLTDMSNRKDRQAENSKATAFFFEGQVKKYMDEIETARQGMSHLKVLDEQLQQAKIEQGDLEKQLTQDCIRTKEQLKAMQEAHNKTKEEIKSKINEAYAELEKASLETMRLQEELQQQLEAEMLQGADFQTLEKEYRLLEQKQMDSVKAVHDEVSHLCRKIEQSETSITSHEESMIMVKEEMDRIVRRLRAIDQLDTATATMDTTNAFAPADSNGTKTGTE